MSVKMNDNGEEKTNTLPDHRVVVLGAPDDADELTQLLIEQADMDAATAHLVARSLPGLLPQLMTRHQAARIAEDIRARGLSAAAVPSGDVPDLSHMRPSHHVRLTEQALEVVDVGDHSDICGWENVRIVSVGVVQSSAPLQHRATSSLAMGNTHRSWSDGVHLSARQRPEVIIVFNQGSALILASDEMSYEYLGRRLASSSRVNFARLVDDLVRFATSAWVTPSTRAFLDRGPVRHYEFSSGEDFRRYTEFQTLLSDQLGHQRRQASHQKNETSSHTSH